MARVTPFVDDPDFRLFVGDALEVLRTLDDGSVDCCVTSPPYWGLRDYGAAGQIGLEPTPGEYVAAMVEVFAEVRRVLAVDGTLWLNLGDSYNTLGQKGPNGHDKSTLTGGGPDYQRDVSRSSPVVRTLKTKDMVGIPWAVAFALRADGWYLRSDIIWAKPNPMPESVTDRPTKSHEYVFLLSKSPRYFFDQEAVREKYAPATVERDAYGYNHAFADQFKGSPTDDRHPEGKALPPGSFAKGPDGRKVTKVVGSDGSIQHRDGERWPNGGRNIRTVWEISTQPYAEAHFATFPEELPRRCILAGCPEWVCADCGIVLDDRYNHRHGNNHSAVPRVRGTDDQEGPVEPDSSLLLEGVRERGNVAQQGIDARLRDEPEGLQASENDEAPDGESRGLRDGAQIGDGGASRTSADSGRGRASQERRQAGQPGRELGSDAEASARSESQAEAASDSVSSLRRPTDAPAPCPACGSVLRRPGVVLDPFSGSGTTALVARKHGRKSVGIELNEDYARLAARRLGQQSLLAEGAA